ncbi:hypothetical protein BDZ94DRAFT_1180407, partial [Collybia nuda]
MGNQDIGKYIGVHRTTVARILKRFEKTADPYYVSPKLGRPRVFDNRETRIAAQMLAKTEAANVTEVVKQAFPEVSRHTIGRRLKEYGLVCRV